MQKLWVDHYRPKRLNDLDYNEKLTQTLHQIAKSSNFPVINYHSTSFSTDPQEQEKKPGSCASFNKFLEMEFIIQRPKKNFLKPTPVKSKLTPSDTQFHDTLIVQNQIKEIAENDTIKGAKNFKVIILNDADKLSKEAQAGLRRTMQDYSSKTKIIMCCQNMCRLIEPLKSRCLFMRIQAPQVTKIFNIMIKIASSQKIDFDYDILRAIAESSDNNLRSAIVQLQIQYIRGNQKKGNVNINLQWKKKINQIAHLILKEQTPEQMIPIRNKLYDLLVNLYLGCTIMKELLKELIVNVKTDQCRKQLISYSSKCQNKMCLGTNNIVHLESFCCHAMLSIKKQRH